MSGSNRVLINTRFGRTLAALAWLAGLLLAPWQSADAAWPFAFGGSESDEVRVVKLAPTGDIYVAGHFRGSMEVVINGNVTTLVSRGGQDIFVVKMNAAGQALWAERAGGVLSDDTVSALELDTAHNAYITGEFYGRATFGGTDLTTVDMNNDDQDGYIAKLGVTGGWVWARGFGSDWNDYSTSIVFLPGTPGLPPTPESFVIAGSFRCSAEFGSLAAVAGICSGANPRDLFVARIDAEGDWIWARSRGASATGNEVAEHLVVDNNQRLWMVGQAAAASGQLFNSPLQDNTDYTSNWSLNFTPFPPTLVPQISFDADLGSVSLQMSGAAWPNIGANYDVTTAPMNASSAVNLVVSIDVQRGASYYGGFFFSEFSEYPEFDDNMVLEYFAGGTWKPLKYYYGGYTAGERFYNRGAQALVITDPAAMNAGFRLRLHYLQKLVPAYFWEDLFVFPGINQFFAYQRPDQWHVENIEVRAEGAPEPFLLDISNATSTSPQINSPTTLPSQFRINDVAVTADGQRLLLTGNRFGDVSYSPCPPIAGQGATVMSLDIASGAPACRFARGAPGGDSRSITTDSTGNAYITGSFEGSVDFYGSPPVSLTSTGGKDIFVGKLDPSLNWLWVTGGDTFDDIDGIPARAGSTGDDVSNAIATGSVGSNLFIGGRFRDSLTVGEADTLESRGLDDGLVFTLGRDGRFPREERWTAGTVITPPPNANILQLVAVPDFRVGGQTFDAIGQKILTWTGPMNGEPAKLIALQPATGIEVRWRVLQPNGQPEPLESPNRISTFGRVVWPDHPCEDNEANGCYQVHVTGAPVEAEPPSGEFRIKELINPSSESSSASYSAGRFAATRTGFSVLIYINGPTLDETIYPTAVEVIRTLSYESMPQFVDNVPAEIGKKIFDPYHSEPGRTGFVVNELAYYDGFGGNAAYNREARTGAIIPVNRYSNSRANDQGKELVVAWYRAKSKGVFWPDKTVRYQPYWPIDPPHIIIASEQGSEVLGQTRLNPTQFQNLALYIQNDPTRPGFNPNDEHALMAPSTQGSGFQAAFALRSDFGSRLAGDVAASSDPYVLLRYFDAAAQETKFRVYDVLATGAGFTQFRYTGVAGTTISPPFPVRQLPGCPDTFAVGQAVGEQPPPPFFQDYKNQLWGKSAGSGAVRYFYPAQPGYFSDRDNNDVNDLEIGQCVPWLARLPAAEGGSESPNDPISVSYEISWPEFTPLLVSGDTLLTPKNNLPDIVNQAAVEVVYDAIQDEVPNALPSQTVAQLLDPVNPRFVRLEAIPSAIASSFGSDGQVSISGSGDGVIKLSVAVRDRLSFDPLNKRLSIKGIFDETGVGEPLLLLNVLSKRDRVQLKTLDGGDGSEQSAFTGTCTALGCSWDQAVEALFRLSRNPQGIQRICTASRLDANRVRVCDSSRAVTADDVLIGYQDLDNNYVLEPYQAVGVAAALSAGLSQGNGYMTLAMNNDPALNPLPVSLEVIQVGCLVSPPPPAVATINKPYQGQLNVIAPDNIFDEQLVLRHSGDFGGNPDVLEFDWYFHPDEDGTPPMPLPDPQNGQLNGWIRFPVANPQGATEISIEGANIQTLSDNWYVARYRGLPACNNQTEWSLWAGGPGATPINQRAQLASGWVKRVLGRLNPFESRVQDFGSTETNTYSSMLILLGERYEGPIALNNDPDNLNSIGLIEAYTTVMRRALQLSVDSTPPINYDPANNAILLVASRLVDFYTLLGNEAYADAQDPTIAITTQGGTFSLAPTIFNFQNQLDSLLTEELVLLRGRDDANATVEANPVYNRLFWNFTTGDGELAYALSYDISDINVSGVIDEFDARILFPQGHGDAWGHYLTGAKIYYQLLRHPFFSWNPRPEAVAVAGAAIQVDFLDERQFAETAAAKARAGAEIVDLTYRSAYIADPDGQWQGYDDVRPERAWGLSEWGRRAGMGAYFDWVTINAIVPAEDPNPMHVGIQKIERGTVSHIDSIEAQYSAVQGQVDKADAGLNPLGLAQNVVPFDFDPTQLDRFNRTQFEQVYERALQAVKNALSVFDYANELANQLRRTSDSSDQLYEHSIDEETDFNNQLIEIFGYPYADDIGPGGIYPAGYDGPDLYHYMLVDVPQLAGTAFDFDDGIDGQDLGINKIETINAVYNPMSNGLGFFGTRPIAVGTPRTGANGQPCTGAPFGSGCPLGDTPDDSIITVQYTTIESPDFGLWFTTPASWNSQRRAPGRLQQHLQQMLEARISLKQSTLEYDKLRLDIVAQMQTLQATFNIAESNLAISNAQRDELKALTIATQVMQSSAIVARRVGVALNQTFGAAQKCVPDTLIFGLAGGGDILSGVKCAIAGAGGIATFALDTAADALDIAGNATDAAKEDVEQLAAIDTQINDASLDLYNLQGEVDALFRQEPLLRAEVFARTEALKQLMGDYRATLAEGGRILQQLEVFRKDAAEDTQVYRFKDMAFRIFRNDALQKYRASFDLAARYVFLAAATYDYETNLLGGDSQAGQEFLTNIVRERNLGQILNGIPRPGAPGLADTLAQLSLNFDVLKGQMGFNNPQVETNRFSLRRELFRIPDGPEGDSEWKRKLEEARVNDLWAIPEFRRYARPFAPQSAGAQPGLVLEFSTNVSFGLNFFGWDLGPQDSSYDSSQFATRIRSVGAWFADYAGLPLADDPRIYVFPVGADVLRSPSGDDFETREWQIIDQAIPVPFPIGSSDLEDYAWNPSDTLSGSATDIRRYGRIKAYHFSEPFDDSQVTSDSRLVGRSVWNRKWMIIIPGGTFLNDPNEGLETFINGARIPGGGTARDGDGIDDIRIFFKTYAYSGN